MNILKETINQLNKEEIRVFKYYAERIYPATERKDLELFELYKKAGEKVSDDILSKKLYGQKGVNAYFRLKNRLVEEIHKSLVIDNADRNKTLQTFYLLCIYQYHLQKQNFKLALHYLKKARKIASENEQYEVLDMIYGEMIKIAREVIELNPEELIQDRQQNTERLNSLRKMDEILAVLNYKLKLSQNMGNTDTLSHNLFDETIRLYANNEELRTPQFRIRIYKAISQLLIQSKDYYNLELWTEKNLKTFETDGIFNRQNQETQLEMQVYLVNSLNAQKKYKEALASGERFFQLIEKSPASIRGKYMYFYYQAKVASLQHINREQAIETLLEMQELKEINTNAYYEMFIYTNLAILYFDAGRYALSAKNLNRAYMNPYYEQTDNALKTALYALEAVVRYEMDDLDVLEYRMAQMKKDLKSWEITDNREALMILLIDKMARSKNILRDQPLKKMAVTLLQRYKDDTGAIADFNTWIQKKLHI